MLSVRATLAKAGSAPAPCGRKCTGAPEDGDGEEAPLFSALRNHQRYRRALYEGLTHPLAGVVNTHHLHQFLVWCDQHDVFIHPSLAIVPQRTEFRDHVFVVREFTPRHTPLLAVPEKLLIGFRNDDDFDKNALFDRKKESNFSEANCGSDSDIVEFFFACLGMIVSDLATALNSALTDPRHAFAKSLGKVRTLQNAPYLPNDVVLDNVETCLGDVLLQMIRNYVNGGPLVGKLDRDELLWCVSVCLSHSTPLVIGSLRSIGIIPFVHLFPHGGTDINSTIVARTDRKNSAASIARFFEENFGLDFGPRYANADAKDPGDEPRLCYVVATRDLEAGEEVHLQAMAPVCSKEAEAVHMWKLACGCAPSSYLPSSDIAAMQRSTTQHLISEGSKLAASATSRSAAASSS